MNEDIFRLEFTFGDRTEDDLQQLNAMLSSVRLTELRLEDFDGYLCTKREYAPDGRLSGVAHRYGFDKVVLAGKRDPEEEAFVYRIDTHTADLETNSDRFHDVWTREHPDRVMRLLTCIQFDQKLAYVVLHHERRYALANG